MNANSKSKKYKFYYTKYVTTAKPHICWGSLKEIPKGTKGCRADTWKYNWERKLYTRYYHPEVAYLFETQSFLRYIPPNYDMPFNPLKGEILQIYPQYFQDHFYNKYQKERRIIILADLRNFFLKLRKIMFAKKFIYWIFAEQTSFDYQDILEFEKTYTLTEQHSKFITYPCNNYEIM